MPTDALLVFLDLSGRRHRPAARATLVEGRVAACVNVVGPVTSVYRWRDAVETAGELLLLIKTPADRYPALEQALRALHPYEVPEIVAVPIERGHEDYLEWVRSCTDVS